MYFERKKAFLRVRDIWFETERNPGEEHSADFVQYHDVPSCFDNCANMLLFTKRETLISDLKLQTEELFSKFKKNTRYEIRRAMKEGCYSNLLLGNQLNENSGILEKINNEHTKMFKQKNKKSKNELPVLLAAAKANMLAASIGYLPSGKESVYHVYIIGNGTARLLHSISIFRESEDLDERNAIARLNRFLHYDDMLKLKELCYSVYDWGGYSEAESLKSISDFKAGFGGEVAPCYSYIFATSALGKIARKIALITRKHS